MFNRKKKIIESQKLTIRVINEERMKLASQNVALQKIIQDMQLKLDLIYEKTVRQKSKKTTNKKEVKKNAK